MTIFFSTSCFRPACMFDSRTHKHVLCLSGMHCDMARPAFLKICISRKESAHKMGGQSWLDHGNKNKPRNMPSHQKHVDLMPLRWMQQAMSHGPCIFHLHYSPLSVAPVTESIADLMGTIPCEPVSARHVCPIVGFFVEIMVRCLED
jgi:hypothetical protein